MPLLVLFHTVSFKNLKNFYFFYVQKRMRKNFPCTVSYNRFVELERKVCVPLAVFVKMMCINEGIGISFIDSTPLQKIATSKGRNSTRHV